MDNSLARLENSLLAQKKKKRPKERLNHRFQAIYLIAIVSLRRCKISTLFRQKERKKVDVGNNVPALRSQPANSALLRRAKYVDPCQATVGICGGQNNIVNTSYLYIEKAGLVFWNRNIWKCDTAHIFFCEQGRWLLSAYHCTLPHSADLGVSWINNEGSENL